MGPYALAPPTQAQPTLEADVGFVGCNYKTPRWLLPPGFTARSENTRYQNNVAADRFGVITPVFANSFAANKLLGSNVYSNPNAREVCLLATQHGAFAIRSGAPAQSIQTENDPIGNIEFCQQFDKSLLHSDDPSMPLMVWDGLSADGYLEVDASKALGNGIVIIPNAPFSINYLGRAWFLIPDLPGWIGASDINDYTVYDSILHQFRVNAGTADAIVGLYPYRAATGLIIGKRQSFDLLGPIPNDLGDSFLLAINLGLAPASAPPPSMNVIPGPEGVGLRSRKAAGWVGEEFHFLSDAGSGGIYRIVQNSSGMAIDPTPVSDAIEPLMQRINWAYAGSACMAVDGTHELWAVPMDGATFNNSILVRNIVTGNWMGHDLWFSRSNTGRSGRATVALPNALRIDNLLGFDFYGRHRIYAIDHAAGVVRLLYEGREDQLAPANKTGLERHTYPIRSTVDTRGYATLSATGESKRKLAALQMVLSTYDPNVTVTELLEGVSDETEKLTFSPDRTQYDRQGKAPYDTSNANDDFLEPKRLDYAIKYGDSFTPGSAPTPVEVEQERTERLSLDREARYVSYRVENDGGNCALVATVVESTPVTREGRTG